MNNLNQIPKTGTFGQAVDAMNTDFGLVQTAITQLEVSAFKDVGYFSSASALRSAYPSPTKGMKADVYDSTAEAYVVYVCNTNGTWTNTGNTDDRQVVVDNYPTDNSTNLVQSGGVKQALNKIGFYDISADHSNTSYASLSQALNAVPTAYQKGGMTVMYIDSTSGLYVQYMLKSASWNKTEGNWEKIDVDEFKDSVYDVSARNGGIKFDSLDALLSDENLATLIPTKYRHGGMEMRFVLTSDNTYVQYRYMGTAVTGTPNPFLDAANWQGVDDKPTANSRNLVESGGVYDELYNAMIASKDWRVSGNVTYDSNEIPISYNITWADGSAGTVVLSNFNDDVFEYTIITATYQSKIIVYTLTYDENGYITNETINIQ